MNEPKSRLLMFGGLLVLLTGLGVASGIVVGLHSSMRKTFIAEFVVSNRSGENVIMTVLGKGPRGTVSVLPQVDSENWPGRYRRPQKIPMSSGERRSIAYSWDDIQFMWIAVRAVNGPWRIVRTGLVWNPQNRDGSMSFQRPDRREYVIPPLKSLPVAPVEIAAAASP